MKIRKRMVVRLYFETWGEPHTTKIKETDDVKSVSIVLQKRTGPKSFEAEVRLYDTEDA